MAAPTTFENKINSLKGLGKSKKAQAVIDSFVNTLTGAGTSRSKVAAGEYIDADLLTAAELETLFADHDLASVIVQKPVDDALRDGFRIEKEGGTADEDQDFAREIKEAFDAIDCDEEKGSLIHRGGVMGRLFGGGGLIIGARGAGALETPLDDTKISKIEWLYDWDRQDLAEHTYHKDGTPETYLWTRPSRGTASWKPVKVHKSRLIMFPGATTTNRKRNQNQGWDLSVLQRVYATLKSFDSMFSSTDAMFADASQAVFKLQGLIAALAESDGTGTADVQTRLQLLDMSRSSGKAIMLDAGDENGEGGEDFTTVDRATLGGLDGTMQQYYVRLAAAARMPLTVLLGMSPAGMDATGESDLILYYNTVDIYRKKVLEPRILRLVRILARQLGDDSPEDWIITWPELARPKPLDVATEEKMKVDACVALVAAQIALPEEVALSMSKIAPMLRLVLDKQARLKALKEGLKELGDREMTGPSAEPEEEPVGVSPPTKASRRKTPSKTAKKQV